MVGLNNNTMTNEEFEEVKTAYIDNIKRFMVETGGLFTHLSIFGDHITPPEDGNANNAIIHVPIDPKFLKSEETKDAFVDDVIPELAKAVRKKFIIKGVAWASEAWMRTAEKDQSIDNWKDLPIKKEVLIVNIETENRNEFSMYEIKRDGQSVTPDGDLIDNIKLIEEESIKKQPESQAGRFTGLYKKFTADVN